MSSRSGIEAGRAFVRMFLDDSEMNAKLKGVQAKMRATGAAIDRTGREMVSLGAKVLLPFVAALAVFVPFSDRMQEVQAVTQATAAEFDVLNEKAKQLGSTTSYTASQVAGLMAELGRAGFNPAQIVSATEHVLALARATKTELPRAAEIMASTLNQFGLSAEDSQRVADVMTATVNGSAQGMEDLAEAMKPVAPIAAEAGASLESTSAAIGVLANNGIRGSLAGNALARAYKNLSTPETRKELDRLNVSVVDSSGNMRALTDIMADVSQATENFGNADRLAVFESLFGRGQAAALKLARASKTTAEKLKQLASPAARQELDKLGVSLTDNASKARSLNDVFEEVKVKSAEMSNQERRVLFEAIGFDDLLSQLRLADGAAAETADIMDSKLGGAFRATGSAIESVAIALAEAVEGPATEWAEWIAGASRRVSQFITRNKALVTLIAKTGVGLLIMGSTFVAVAGAIKVVVFVLGTYRLALTAATAAKAALLALSGPKGWALLAVGVGVATGAVLALNSAMEEDAEAAKAAADANETVTEKMERAQKAVDGLKQAGPPDLTPEGVAELEKAETATERLAVTMASLRGETEAALRLASAGDALKTLSLLGGDSEQDAADRVRKMLESAVPPSEKLKAKLMEVDAAFDLLDQDRPEVFRLQWQLEGVPEEEIQRRLRDMENLASQAEIKHSIKVELLEQSTGVFSTLRDLQNEIAVLEGNATEAGIRMHEMLDKGVPPELVERFRDLTELRDKLSEQQKTAEAAQKQRQKTEQQQLSALKSKADSIRDQNTTADERIQIELSELEQLRKAIDPETNTPLLDEETYRRELERLHARQIELAAQDAKRINGGAQQFASDDLRSQGGANAFIDLLNGRLSHDEQQLIQLVSTNEKLDNLIELSEEQAIIRKVKI